MLSANGEELEFHSVNFNYEDENVFPGYIFLGFMTLESFENSKGKELHELDYTYCLLAGGLYLKSNLEYELHKDDGYYDYYDYYTNNCFIQVGAYSHYSDAPFPEEIDTDKLVFENLSKESDATDMYCSNTCFVKYDGEIIINIQSREYIKDAFLEKIRDTLVVFRGKGSLRLPEF